jgi:hypothetical protein
MSSVSVRRKTAPISSIHRGARNGLPHHARRQDARLQDLVTIPGVVSAVDAPSGQVDHDVASVDLPLPITRRRTVPRHDAPWTDGGVTAQHNDVIAGLMEGAGEYRSDLPGAAWNNNLAAALQVRWIHVNISERVH